MASPLPAQFRRYLKISIDNLSYRWNAVSDYLIAPQPSLITEVRGITCARRIYLIHGVHVISKALTDARENALAVLEVPAKDFGPAMSALHPRHRAFVIALFALGTNDATAAARLVYTDNGTGAVKVQAHRLLHRPDVQAAIEEEGKRRVKSLVPLGVAELTHIVSNRQHKDQLKAIGMTLNRAGLTEVHESKVTHEIVLTRQEKIAEIRTLAETLGVDPKTLLGNVTDAEFEEITPDAGPEPEVW